MRHVHRPLIAALLVLAVAAPGAFAQSATGSAAMSDSGAVHHRTTTRHRHHRIRRHKKTTTTKTHASTTTKAKRVGAKLSAKVPGTHGKTVPFVKRVDLNDATRTELLKLPGITADLANRIIAARPFTEGHDLVTKGILTEEEYDRIQHRVTVK